MGRKKGRKRKKKKQKTGGLPQRQQQTNTVLKQANLDGLIVETLDVEGFGDCFHPTQSTESTRVAFQNSGPQPQYRTSKKATDGALAMEAGKFDVLLFAEHGLYPPALQPRNGWHDRMSTRNKGTYSRLSYNTNDGEGTKWNQYGGTGITLNANLKSRMTTSGSGDDPTKLGRRTWVRIGGKDGIATVFVSAYRPCKNTSGLYTVWSQQD